MKGEIDRLEIQFRDNVTDAEKSLLHDYWNLELRIKDLEHKYELSPVELRDIVRYQGKVTYKNSCAQCTSEVQYRISSRADLQKKAKNDLLCETCQTEYNSLQAAERERKRQEELAEIEEEKLYFQEQHKIGREKMTHAIENKTWLNLDDEGIMLLRQIYKVERLNQLGHSYFHYGKTTRKLKLYLELFDKLGLIHILYKYLGPYRTPNILKNDAIFPYLFLNKRSHNEFSIQLKINKNPQKPTSPTFRNSIQFDTLRLLEPDKTYLCGLWPMPDGSMNLKITPIDQIVKGAKEVDRSEFD